MHDNSLQGLFQRKTVFWKSFIFRQEPLQTQSDTRNLEKAVPQLAWPHASKCYLYNIASALDDAKQRAMVWAKVPDVFLPLHIEARSFSGAQNCNAVSHEGLERDRQNKGAETYQDSLQPSEATTLLSWSCHSLFWEHKATK